MFLGSDHKVATPLPYNLVYARHSLLVASEVAGGRVECAAGTVVLVGKLSRQASRVSTAILQSIAKRDQGGKAEPTLM